MIVSCQGTTSLEGGRYVMGNLGRIVVVQGCFGMTRGGLRRCCEEERKQATSRDWELLCWELPVCKEPIHLVILLLITVSWCIDST